MTTLPEATEWLRDQRAQRRDDPELVPTSKERMQLMDYPLDQLQEVLVEGLGQKKFRGAQIYQWLYHHFVTGAQEMTNLSKTLRADIEALMEVNPLEHTGTHVASDGTAKLTFKCYDNAVIETVYIPSENRNTLCISSQVGCAMGCTFCWTAKMGLRRNLSTAEIVAQVVWARKLMGETNGHIGNIVFMGMGEPLHNYDNVVQSIHIMTDQRGLDFSRRKITVSTSGLVPQIKRLGEDVDINLAISLNATTDVQRSSIMPVNERWDIDALLDCLREYPLEKRQRITFEYVLIRDINDSLEDANRLVLLLKGMKAKVNLIPFNAHPNAPFEPPEEHIIDMFQEALAAQGLSCFRRVTRGRDEMAACGQLGKPGDRKAPRHVRKRVEHFEKLKSQQA